MRSALTLLVRLLPPAFRHQFGADIEEQIEKDYQRARSKGRLRALAFSVATAVDLARTALQERWDPAWVRHETTTSTWEGLGMMTSEWMKDLRHAFRSLSRSPGFTVVAVGTLALAIGANAGIFSVVKAVLLDPLPYPDAGDLVYIAASAPGSDLPDEFGVSEEFGVEYRDESRLLTGVGSYYWFTATLRVGDRVERPGMSVVEASTLEVLGANPILGRLPTPEDEDRVAVISHALWTTWFGADPAVLGQSVEMAGANRTIIGVMGPDFWFPNEQVVAWIPRVVQAEDITPGRFGLNLVGRLAPGATRADLVDELTQLALRLPERFGGSAAYARMIRQHRPIIRPLEKEFLGEVSTPLWVLLGSVAIVLLIACANVANLFVVRAERKQRSLAVRRALGASRAQLVRSLMAEAVVVAALAGGLAVLLAWVSVPVFLRASPPDIPRLGQVTVGLPTLLFTLAASAFCTLACGLLPAIRGAAPNMTRLRDAGRGSTRRRHWARDGLVAAQTALALVLLIGSGLLVRSFWALRSVDPGYQTEDLFSFQMAPDQDQLTDGPSWGAFHMAFMDRLAALPGVESVGIVENLPLDEGLGSGRFLTEEHAGDTEGGSLLWYTFSGGDYFGAMGISVLQGRAFTRSDNVSDLGNVILSRSAADLLFPGQDPIGKRLRNRDGGPDLMTVVGVVEDIMQYNFRRKPDPMIYFPLVGPTPDAWALSSPAYVVKSSRAEVIAPEIRALVHEVAPEAPMYRIYTMAGLARSSMIQLSFTMLTLGIVSLLALILGTVGLFGVLSYIVTERTREIGLRMALGAESRRVRRMVVAQGARVVGVGVVIGVATALASTRLLASLLFGVQALDGPTFVGMSAAMIVVGLLASYLPARRASSVDPIVSLRADG